MNGKSRSKRKLQTHWESAFSPKRIHVNLEDENLDQPEREEETLIGDDVNWSFWDEENDMEENNKSASDLPATEDEEEDENFNFIGFNEAISYIAAVFLQNNVSRNFGKDFFQCARLLSLHADIKISHIRRKMESWSDYDTRTYSFCISCSSILTSAKKCTNASCSRYSISQANISSLKTVVTYSIRQQIQEMLECGVFDEQLLTRSRKEPCVLKRLCDTAKYLERLRKCEKTHPDLITLLVTLNTDGFRKRGCSRGEIWPLFLAAHDVAKGTGSYREYRPQFVILAGIMQTNTKLNPVDFQSFFERMKMDLNDTTENPLRVKIGDKMYGVRIELFQSCLDMDASRKIRGLPVWQSYGSCSLCNIEGKQVKTKTGRKLCWYSSEAADDYDDSYPPGKLLDTCLPPPWADGFDNLHIIAEGISRDLMKDLLGNGSKTGFPIRKKMRCQWSKALCAANTPRGRASASLLDPIQLSTRTGCEIFDLAVPILVTIHSTANNWLLMTMIHWLVTRTVTDCHLTNKQCENIQVILPTLKSIVGRQFPCLFSLKFHYFVDHLVPTIQYHGSPLLSSAASFERLNQTLGRSSNSFTTKTLMNISNRFMAMKRAAQHCSDLAIKKRITPPMTMIGTIGCCDEKTVSIGGLDYEQLTEDESNVLRNVTNTISSLELRKSYDNGNNVFSTRRSCINKPIHNCYVYYIDESGIMVGRILRKPKGLASSVQDTVKREQQEPATRKKTGVNNKKGKRGLDPTHPVYRSPADVEKKYPHLKLYEEEQDNYEDMDIHNASNELEEQYGFDFENSQYSDFSDTNLHGETSTCYLRQRDDKFKITSFLSKPKAPKNQMENLKDAVKEGNVLKIGESLRQGFSDNSLTEIQVEEFIKMTPKPSLSLFQFHQQLESASESDRNSLQMGQLFLTKMAMTESSTINKLKASVSSLASSFSEQTKVALLSKRQLEENHIINPTQGFPRIDLLNIYNKTSLVGDTAFSQMTFFLTRTFKQVRSPSYTIWLYTYRPKCIRPTDKHFELFPEEIADKLLDFVYDAVGVYLPEDLLVGEIDPGNKFVKSLTNADPIKEVQRRRKDREMVADTMKGSIGQALNYMRDYHYIIETDQLENCKARTSCTEHLTWRDLKLFREYCRENSKDINQYDITDIIGFSTKCSNIHKDKGIPQKD